MAAAAVVHVAAVAVTSRSGTVAAGRFARIGIITHKGYVNTSATAEDIAGNIEEIRTIKDGKYPLSNEDELMIIQEAIQGS